jgi:hypothetical protein
LLIEEVLEGLQVVFGRIHNENISPFNKRSQG